MLKAEFQSISNSHEELKREHAELWGEYQKLFDEFNSLNQTHYTLMQNYTELSTEYQRVLTNYVNLMLAYTSLNETYNSLLQNYTELANANLNYTELLNQYKTLMQNYTQLKTEYDKLYAAFYEPLLSEDKVVPTVAELTQWLTEDKTDKISYTYPDFVCGDFAVMLHLHAKLKHWDMGVVGVLGTLNGQEFNHAFNAIICRENEENVTVYVEPQNDQIFYGPIEEGNSYEHPGFGNVTVREFIVIILYDGE